MSELAVPEGLKTRGVRFWSNITEQFDLGEGERELLEEACRALDLADQLHAVVLADGPMSVGSRGQPAAHPALNQLHSVRGVLAKLLSTLDFPAEERVWSDASRRAQHAARSRWDSDADIRALRARTS